MSDAQLLAQDLVQQGAVHAITTLLQIGCTEENAIAMMGSLREFAGEIRKEGKSRGIEQFEKDQTAFN